MPQRHSTPWGIALVAGLVIPFLVGCGSTRDRGPGEPHHAKRRHPGGHHHDHGGDHATVTHRFEDAEYWAQRFESPDRDRWQFPDRVIEWLELGEDSKVADIGSATGYFPVRIAPHVPPGIVYGVDVEPNLVNYLNLRARREGLSNLVSLVCTADDPALPEPVDVVLVVNTYHHIGDRVGYFRRLQTRLRPGARLAIVDFRKGDFPVGPGDDHKLAPEQVTAELEQAGYEKSRDERLPYQYVLIYEVTDG